MNRVALEQRYVRPVITTVCAYEAVALFSRKVPSVSSLLWRAREYPAGRIALWALWGWTTAHIFAATVEELVEVTVEELVEDRP